MQNHVLNMFLIWERILFVTTLKTPLFFAAQFSVNIGLLRISTFQLKEFTCSKIYSYHILVQTTKE